MYLSTFSGDIDVFATFRYVQDYDASIPYMYLLSKKTACTSHVLLRVAVACRTAQYSTHIIPTVLLNINTGVPAGQARQA